LSHAVPLIEEIIYAATSAADALTLLLGCRARVLPDRAAWVSAGAASPEYQDGVFADLTGALSGCAALVLPDYTSRAVVRRLSPGAGRADVEQTQGVLCEVGNIAISAASGALTSSAGELVIPSPPRFASVRLESTPESRICVAPIEFDDDGTARPLLFAWLPPV
jgi:chemotaxis protein CheY-P-specific phosphatase CheC